MDILAPVTYRGLTLTGAAGGPGGDQPISGYRLTRADYSDVSVHGYTEKKSLEDGFDASDVFLGMRRIILQGEVYAPSLALLFDLLDTFRLIFTPTDAYNQDPRQRGYLPLYFQQPTVLTDDWSSGIIPREINCRPSAQPQFDIQMNAINADTGGFVVPFVVRLDARDPRFYGQTDIAYNFTGTGTTGSVRNRGNYPAPANFVLGSSVAGAKTFTFIGAGTNMTVTIPDGTAGTMRTVVVDGYDKVCTLTIGTTETLRMDLVSFAADTTWPKIMPTPQGDPSISFDWTYSGAAGPAAGSRMFFRETWV